MKKKVERLVRLFLIPAASTRAKYENQLFEKSLAKALEQARRLGQKGKRLRLFPSYATINATLRSSGTLVLAGTPVPPKPLDHEYARLRTATAFVSTRNDSNDKAYR